jgi:hypothetical protein
MPAELLLDEELVHRLPLPLDDIRKRFSRACYAASLARGDWAGAEADFRRSRAMSADTAEMWHHRAWAMLAWSRQRQALGGACLLPGQDSPLGRALSLWPRGPDDTSAFRQVYAEMAERFPAPADAATADSVAWTRLLLADGLTEADTARLEQFSKTARDSKPDSDGYLETYGAALYRSGQLLDRAGNGPAAAAKFDQAIEQLDAAANKTGEASSVWQDCQMP